MPPAATVFDGPVAGHGIGAAPVGPGRDRAVCEARRRDAPRSPFAPAGEPGGRSGVARARGEPAAGGRRAPARPRALERRGTGRRDHGSAPPGAAAAVRRRALGSAAAPRGRPARARARGAPRLAGAPAGRDCGGRLLVPPARLDPRAAASPRRREGGRRPRAGGGNQAVGIRGAPARHHPRAAPGHGTPAPRDGDGASVPLRGEAPRDPRSGPAAPGPFRRAGARGRGRVPGGGVGGRGPAAVGAPLRGGSAFGLSRAEEPAHVAPASRSAKSPSRCDKASPAPAEEPVDLPASDRTFESMRRAAAETADEADPAVAAETPERARAR